MAKLDLEQAERDGWRVEVWSDVIQIWYEGRYLAGPDDAGDYAVWYRRHGQWILAHVEPNLVRNLQPKTMKVPVQLIPMPYSNKYRAVTPGSADFKHAKKVDGIAEVPPDARIEVLTRKCGYDPSTGEPLAEQCEHDWYRPLDPKPGDSEWTTYCRNCGQRKETP